VVCRPQRYRAEGSEVVAIGTAGAILSDHAVIEPELRHRIFQVDIPDWPSSAGDLVHVVFAGKGDSVPFASIALNRSGQVSGTEFEGECYLTAERRIGGLAWAPGEPRKTVKVVIHIAGQFRQSVTPSLSCTEIKGHGSGEHGFLLDLPEGLDPAQSHIVDVVIHDTNYHLKHSPLTVPSAQAEEQNRPGTRRTCLSAGETSSGDLLLPDNGLAGVPS
jgi:hypothetical protein